MSFLHNQIELSEVFQKGVVCDLHCHSSYAGGTGSLDLQTAVANMPQKGVTLVGTGDCLYRPWLKTLKEKLHDPNDTGIFELKNATDFAKRTKFVLQTELAFTAPIGVYRKNVHCVFLWPSFNAVEQAIELLEKFKVKNTIGRPFITSKNTENTAVKINALLDIDPFVEFFPAHVLVPLGIYGPKPSITFLEDFFGDAAKRIHAVETGLSADPTITALIPELDDLTLLSNSDAHSPALNRLGRELTSLDLKKITYKELIYAIRNNRVCYTAEFHPSEGRYFLTGHRGGVRGHKNNEFCIFSPDQVPKNNLCPICGLSLKPGVLQRAMELSEDQGANREFGKMYGKKREFYRMVPLVEIIAKSIGLASPRAKKVRKIYELIVSAIGNECKLWTTTLSTIEELLKPLVKEELLQSILAVRQGNFCFDPAGFDGSYGELTFEKTSNYQGIRMIQSQREIKQQTTLDDFN